MVAGAGSRQKARSTDGRAGFAIRGGGQAGSGAAVAAGATGRVRVVVQMRPNGSPANSAASAAPTTGPPSSGMPAIHANTFQAYQPAMNQRRAAAIRFVMRRSVSRPAAHRNGKFVP